MSIDEYVHVPLRGLPELKLRHLISGLDPTIAPVGSSEIEVSLTGYTEWVGAWEGRPVSVGWDWGLVRGLVIVLNPNEIRTNISLIGDDARPEPRGRACMRLLEWIEKMQWRETAIVPILREQT